MSQIMSETPPNTQSLDLQKVGFEYTILDLRGEAFSVSRLQELGFIKGERVLLKSKIIFGEPYIVEVRGTQIALRKSEAGCIFVESGLK